MYLYKYETGTRAFYNTEVVDEKNPLSVTSYSIHGKLARETSTSRGGIDQAQLARTRSQ